MLLAQSSCPACAMLSASCGRHRACPTPPADVKIVLPTAAFHTGQYKDDFRPFFCQSLRHAKACRSQASADMGGNSQPNISTRMAYTLIPHCRALDAPSVMVALHTPAVSPDAGWARQWATLCSH
jgi:hypothetical protein